MTVRLLGLARKAGAYVIFVGAPVFVGLTFTGQGDPRKSPYYLEFADAVATPILQRLDPEEAHDMAIKLLEMGVAPRDPKVTKRHGLKTEVFGRTFSSPLGLAAGFDKQGKALPALSKMGFGYVEVGGVTPLPQPGNSRPRMFRLPEDSAIINRFGLNSDGAGVVAQRLACARAGEGGVEKDLGVVVGVNLAKNTLSEDAIADYVQGVNVLGPHVEVVVLNVSCPNVSWTKGLSGDSGAMLALVSAVADAVKSLPLQARASRPTLLLKVSPDMEGPAREHVAELALRVDGVDGLVVANTTSTRPGTLKSAHAHERGGLSGEPVKAAALATLKELYVLTRGQVPLVGVGGIASGQDAYERIRAGASLVQVYTALTLQGPGLVRRINDDLAALLARDGFACVADAVGVDTPLPPPPAAAAAAAAAVLGDSGEPSTKTVAPGPSPLGWLRIFSR